MPDSKGELLAALEYCYVRSVLCITIIVEILKLLIHHKFAVQFVSV